MINDNSKESKMNNCYRCDDTATEADSFKCDGVCDRNVHAKCVGFTKTVFKAYTDMPNLYYVCDDCNGETLKMINKKLLVIMNTINVYDERSVRNENKLDSLCEEIKQMKSVNNNKCVNLNNVQTADQRVKPTYADQVKRSKNSVIFIKPKNDQNGKKTENDFKNSVDPCAVNVNKIQKGPKGGLAVICENNDDCSEIEKIVNEKLGDDYTVNKQVECAYKLKIVGIGDDLSENEIVESLKGQNEFLKDVDITVLSKYNVKRNKSINVIIKVEETAFNKCMDIGFVKIKWSKCRVFESLSIMVCYKCQGYNHRADICQKQSSL